MKSINNLAPKMSCSRIESSNLAYWFFIASHPFRVNFSTAKAMCRVRTDMIKVGSTGSTLEEPNPKF